jgi:hypothetical protein
METFYSPLFSHCFPFSNFPAILFPSVILLPSKSFPHQKSQSKRIKAKLPKNPSPQKSSKPKAKGKKQKAPSPPSGGLL